jgi:hypothetical protein
MLHRRVFKAQQAHEHATPPLVGASAVEMQLQIIHMTMSTPYNCIMRVRRRRDSCQFPPSDGCLFSWSRNIQLHERSWIRNLDWNMPNDRRRMSRIVPRNLPRNKAVETIDMQSTSPTIGYRLTLQEFGYGRCRGQKKSTNSHWILRTWHAKARLTGA